MSTPKWKIRSYYHTSLYRPYGVKRVSYTGGTYGHYYWYTWSAWPTTRDGYLGPAESLEEALKLIEIVERQTKHGN